MDLDKAEKTTGLSGDRWSKGNVSLESMGHDGETGARREKVEEVDERGY